MPLRYRTLGFSVNWRREVWRRDGNWRCDPPQERNWEVDRPGSVHQIIGVLVDKSSRICLTARGEPPLTSAHLPYDLV